jgi:MarR family transcriptional regulator, organic hydroperoxide resistance regulator
VRKPHRTKRLPVSPRGALYPSAVAGGAPAHLAPGVEPLEPALDFLRSLWLLNHRLETTSRHMIRTIGLTGPQRMVLRVIGRNSGIGAGSLAELLHVSPGTLSSALRRLEKKGLLTRRPDAADRRRILVDLTPRGRLLDRPTRRTVESAVRAALAELPPSKILSAKQVLVALARHLESAAG